MLRRVCSQIMFHMAGAVSVGRGRQCDEDDSITHCAMDLRQSKNESLSTLSKVSFVVPDFTGGLHSVSAS
jgi:hypothetical protein